MADIASEELTVLAGVIEILTTSTVKYSWNIEVVIGQFTIIACSFKMVLMKTATLMNQSRLL